VVEPSLFKSVLGSSLRIVLSPLPRLRDLCGQDLCSGFRVQAQVPVLTPVKGTPTMGGFLLYSGPQLAEDFWSRRRAPAKGVESCPGEGLSAVLLSHRRHDVAR